MNMLDEDEESERLFSYIMTHEKARNAPPPVLSPSPLQPDPIRGICIAFCPTNETVERLQTQDLSRFECPRSDAQELVPVKKYRRAAAGRDLCEPGNLRPAPLLLRTLHHLFTKVLPWPQSGFDAWRDCRWAQDAEFLAVYHFVNDRIRSVRQDFTVQQIKDTSLVTALQQIVRFYVLAGLRAVQLLPDATYRQAWSETLNDQQLASALSELQALYRAHDGAALDSLEREEFTAYDLLLHAKEPQTIAWMLLRLSPTQRTLPSVQRAIRTLVALQTDDFYAFFAQVDAMSMLERAISLRHLPTVWTRTLRMMTKGCRQQEWVSLEQLIRWMGLAYLPSQDEKNKLAEILCPGLRNSIQTDISHKWDCSIGIARFQAATLQDQVDSTTLRRVLRSVAIQWEDEKTVPSPDLIMGATQCNAR